MSERVTEGVTAPDEPQLMDRDGRQAWLERCREAERENQAKWAEQSGVSPSLAHPVLPWEDPNVPELERQYFKMMHEHKAFFAQGARFSPAAYAAVHTPEIAHFLDDIQYRLLDDTGHIVSLAERDEAVDDAIFEKQFDYSEGRIHAYTESGTIVHIRETLDQAAKTREQRFFIIVANLMTQDIKRLYADEQVNADPVLHTAGSLSFDRTMPLRTHQLSRHAGLGAVDTDNPFASLYQQVHDTYDVDMQPKLRFAARGAVLYKPEGHADFSELHPIERLTCERRLLAQIAFASGRQLEGSSVAMPQSSQTHVA